MINSFLKHRILTRLVGGVTFAVFLGWFVLPSCHCQWDLVFGDDPALSEGADLAISADQPIPSDQPCDCHDCPAKAFQSTNGEVNRTVPEPSAFLAISSSTLPILGGFFNDALSRGPPPQADPRHPEPRTYLRHRALLL